MSKIRLKGLVLCFLGSISFVVVLFYISAYKNNQDNGFIRKLPPHMLRGSWFLDLKSSTYYYAGENGNNVYFGNFDKINGLLRINLRSKDTLTQLVTAPGKMMLFDDMLLKVDSTNVYLSDGMARVVYQGPINQLRLTHKTETWGFTAATPLSVSTYLFKSINIKRENTLSKQVGDRQFTKAFPNLLQKQGEGLFSSDGTLLKVPGTNKIFYVYYYRNQFVCADTNLNLLYRGKTIDTITHAQIKVGAISSDRQLTLSAPPVFVNNQACANKRYLFIHSERRSDNQTQRELQEGSVIDVYTVKDGKYQFSFYLPKFNSKKMTGFNVKDNTLLVMFGSYLYFFQLNF